jgi:hypothetical protein
MELDLRKHHGTDYRRDREPARPRARPSSMKITARRAATAHAVVPRTASACAALLAGAGLLLITGCAGAARSGTSSSSARSAAGAAVPSAEAGPVNGAAAPAAPAAGASAPAFSGGGATGQADAAKLAPLSQSIIYTANLTVDVSSAMTAAGRAASYAAGAGGYTAGEQARAGSRRQRAQVSLTLKIPVAGYQAALGALSRLGHQTALSQQSADVTQQVADVGSRVTSEQTEIGQLRGLLRRTASVTGLLQVQQQLSSDESQLESLQAQQRALDHETTYATISVLLLGPVPRLAVAHRPARHGFAAGLAAGWHGLGRATAWLLTAVGAVLPFAVVLAVLGGLGLLGRRRLARLARRRRPAEPAA